ncbi:MAG: glycosyltransferase [Candidatus Binatia bacterium]
MRILELHASCFRVPWRRDHEVVAWGFGSRVDVRAGGTPVQLPDLLRSLPKGFVPDLIALGEDGPLLRVLGLEDAPCPTVLLSLDARGHLGWQGQLARALDVVCLGRRDALPAFSGANAGWLAPWAPDGIPESVGARSCPVTVIGAPLAEDPHGLLARLARRAPVRFAEGPSAALFGQSRIVVRHPAASLDARVLQAVACGALLVAERTGDGLLELFEDGQEIVTVPRGDPEALAVVVARHLEAEGLREAIAERGRACVRARHLRSHRAAEVLARVAQAPPRTSAPIRYAAAARAYCQLGEHARLLPVDSPYTVAPQAYFSAAARLALGVDMLEADRRAVFARIALAVGDLAQGISHLDVAALAGAAPEDHVLRIETLVRAGEIKRARAAAEEFAGAYPEEPSSLSMIARLAALPGPGPAVRSRTVTAPSSIDAAREALDRAADNARDAAAIFARHVSGVRGQDLFTWWWSRSPNRPQVTDRTCVDLLTEIPLGARGLDLGSRQPVRPDAVCLDIAPGTQVHVVGDGARLPFGDDVFDYVWCDAVLGHVRHPSEVAAEIHRVLRPGGRAFVRVPFLENVGAAGDYYRFTPEGLGVLFEDMTPVASGTAAGPSQVLPDLLQYFATAFAELQGGGVLVNLVTIAVGASLLPVRWLDRLLAQRPSYWKWARSFYLVAEKPLEAAIALVVGEGDARA